MTIKWLNFAEYGYDKYPMQSPTPLYGYHNPADERKLKEPIKSPIEKNYYEHRGEGGATWDEYLLLTELCKALAIAGRVGVQMQEWHIKAPLPEQAGEVMYILIQLLGFDCVAEVEVDVLQEIKQFNKLVSHLNQTLDLNLFVPTERIKKRIENSHMFVYNYYSESATMEVIVNWQGFIVEINKCYHDKKEKIRIPLNIEGLQYFVFDIYGDYANRCMHVDDAYKFSSLRECDYEGASIYRSMINPYEPYEYDVTTLPSIKFINDAGKYIESVGFSSGEWYCCEYQGRRDVWEAQFYDPLSDNYDDDDIDLPF